MDSTLQNISSRVAAIEADIADLKQVDNNKQNQLTRRRVIGTRNSVERIRVLLEEQKKNAKIHTKSTTYGPISSADNLVELENTLVDPEVSAQYVSTINLLNIFCTFY